MRREEEERKADGRKTKRQDEIQQNQREQNLEAMERKIKCGTEKKPTTDKKLMQNSKEMRREQEFWEWREKRYQEDQ